MAAALRGRRNADKDRARRSLLHAYHTGMFAGLAWAGKLKPFNEYLADDDSEQRTQSAQALAFFHTLKARGFPIDIKKTVN